MEKGKYFSKSKLSFLLATALTAVLHLFALFASGKGRHRALFISALFSGHIHTDFLGLLTRHLVDHLLAVPSGHRAALTVRDICALLPLLDASGDVGDIGADLVWDILAGFPGDLARHLVEDLSAFLPGDILTLLLRHLVANFLVQGLVDGSSYLVTNLLRDISADLFRHLSSHLLLHILTLRLRDKPAALNIFGSALFFVDSITVFLRPTAGVPLRAFLNRNILASLSWHLVTLVLLDLAAFLPYFHILDCAELCAALLANGGAALVLLDGLGHLPLHGVALHFGNIAALVIEYSVAFLSWYRIEDCIEFCSTLASSLRATLLPGGGFLDREVDSSAFLSQNIIADILRDVAAFSPGDGVEHSGELGLALLVVDSGAAVVILQLSTRDPHVLTDRRMRTGRLLRLLGEERDNYRQEAGEQDENLHSDASSRGKM